MNMKMNTDFLKNINIPPIQLPKVPKLKAHKIFSSTTHLSSSSTPSTVKDVEIPAAAAAVTTVTTTGIIASGTSLNLVTQQQYGYHGSMYEIHQDLSPKPKPLVKAPVTISTISSLVDGAPTYHYSFDETVIPPHVIERIIEDDEKQQQQIQQQQQQNQNESKSKLKKCTPGNLTKRFNKHYKELSEFKLKDIFSKKTVVQKTEIHPDAYAPTRNFSFDYGGETEDRYGRTVLESRYHPDVQRIDSIDDTDNEIQEESDHYNDSDRDHHNRNDEITKTSSAGVRSQPSCKRRKFGSIRQISEESTSSTKWSFPKAASLQALSSSIKPNDSTLWRMKKSKSKTSTAVENTTTTAVEGASENVEKVTDKRSRFSRRTLSRQDFDAAFDKAKKSVNSKIRQLKFLQSSKGTNSRDSEKSAKRPSMTMLSGPVIEIIDRRGSFDSFDSEVQLPEADLRVLKDEWIAAKLLTSDEIPRCLLERQESIIEETTVCIVSCSVPPIPSDEFESRIEEITSEDEDNSVAKHVALPVVPRRRTPPPIPSSSGQIIAVAVYQASSSGNAPSTRKNVFPDVPKGHSRKPSMDSTDSDSWIPEKLRGMTRSQAGLNKIEELTDAWQVNNKNDEDYNSKVLKTQSVDIFKHEGEEAFEDFDTVLLNAPVISVKKDSSLSSSLENEYCDRKSVDFSTTDDDEDELEPDILSVVELPHITVPIPDEMIPEIRITDDEIYSDQQTRQVDIRQSQEEEEEEAEEGEEEAEDSIDTNDDEIILNSNSNVISLPPPPTVAEIKPMKIEFHKFKLSDGKSFSTFSKNFEISGDDVIDLPEIPFTNIKLNIESNTSETNTQNDNKKIKTTTTMITSSLKTTTKDTSHPPKLSTLIEQKHPLLSGNENQNHNLNKTLIKQSFMKQQFSDELESENLTDVSVNKLISKFENQKSSSSLETPKHNQITVEAIIESKGYQIDSPKLSNDNNNNNNTSSLISDFSSSLSLENDDNQNISRIFSNHQQQQIVFGQRYSMDSLKSRNFEDEEFSSLENNYDSNNNSLLTDTKTVPVTVTATTATATATANAIKNSNNKMITTSNKMIATNRRSLQWAKSSKSINKTIDMPPDKDDIEIFYSFEDDEDSKRSNSITSTASTTTNLASGKKMGGKNTVHRHVYNAVL